MVLPPVPAKRRPRPAGRRRRRYGAVAVVTALLLLIGRGLGVLGGAPEPQQGAQGGDIGGSGQHDAKAAPLTDLSSNRNQASPAGPAAVRPAAPAAETTTATKPGADAAVPQPADGSSVGEPAQSAQSAPSAQSAASPTDHAAAPQSAERGMARDRFASRLSLIEQRLVDGRLSAARASLEHLQAQPHDDQQQLLLARLAARIDAAMAGQGRQLLTQLQRGEVLAAVRTADQLVGAGEARLASFLTTAAPALAAATETLPADWRQALAPVDGALPAAVPVARNRRVRVRWRDEMHTGVVVSSRSDQVTVRIQTASGQSYPTVPAVAFEPVEAAAAEAVEMGLAAVHAGKPMLARLWYVRALLVADGPLPERGQRLAALLR